MKRTLVLTLMALLIAIVGVQPLYAQDFAYSAVNQSLPGLTNNGVTGASALSGYLNTTLNDGAGVQANGLGTFNALDVAVGDFNADGLEDIIAATNDGGVGQITLFVGLNDGTFGLPLALLTTAPPLSLAAADIDLDGITDLAVGEMTGIDVVTGFFLSTGVATSFDSFLPTAAPVAALTFARTNDDPFQDIVAVEQATTNVEVFDSDQFNFAYDQGSQIFATNGLISTSAGLIVPAPRAVSANISNFTDPTSGQVDADIDIFVATTMGVEVLENQSLANAPLSTFVLNGTVTAATGTVGVVAIDVNADNIPDVIALNRGSGNVTTNLANASSPGYGTPRVSVVGANPVSLTTMNFNGDGKVDILVANSGFATAGTGSVQVLTGTGTGVFTLAQTFNLNTGDPIFNPQSVAVGQFDAASQTDDIVIAEGTFLPFSPGGVYFLSASQGYLPVVLKIITAVSLAADFDGTGGLNDIAVMEQNFGFVVVLLNLTTSAPPNIGILLLRDLFTNRNVIPTSATAFKDALTGLNDIAVTDIGTPQNNSGFGQIIVGLNDGTGNFLDLRQFRQFVATPGATNILNGDFNNDGIDDLVYVDFGSNFAAVALNDGTNFFLTPQFRETGGFIPVSAAIADVNDDDNLDVLALNEGAGVASGNQSLVSVLIGTGDGRLVPTGSLLQVPNFGLSIVGGLADVEANGVRRVVDFNGDGFPDFAVVSTRGAISSIGLFVPTVSLVLNRIDAPGQFNVQPPIPLIDDTAATGGTALQLEDIVGGPGIVSGRGGQSGSLAGIGLGGANYTLAVGDFNADGQPDLVVTGTRLSLGVNFRSAIYLVGNETNGTLRISRPQRTASYTLNGLGVLDPLSNGGDTFVACATGNFAPLANRVPDVVHISVNGNLWIDANISSILNHAPILTIRRADLNAPFPGGGRKVEITAGESAEVPVTGFDPDGDRLTFRLAPTSTGQQNPSFVTIMDNGNNTATVKINAGDVNRGPGNAIFRIVVEATDASTSGPGGRLPLIGREYFTLVVKPNSPPTIGSIPNQTLEAGKSATVQLSVSDPEGNTITNTVKCDKGNFVTVNGTTLSIAPQAGDVGTSTCTVTATDQFGLASSTTFAVTVLPQNLPPTLGTIADQTVRQGQTVSVNVSANDPNGNAGLRLSLTSAPAFVSLSDNGNGTGVIRISPALTDAQGGRVTVQVTDPGGLTAMTSFNVTVQKAVTITAASFDTAGKQLFISGTGFGSSGATVTVNGTNVSARVIGQSDTSITVKGGKKKLNLKSGPNQIVVTAGGVTSAPFVLNLLKD